jgi:hypothetical protein
MLSSKKLDLLRDLAAGVYQSIIFSTQLCELLPLSPSLWFNSPPPV